MNGTSGTHSLVYVTDSPADGATLTPEFLSVADVVAILRLSEREVYRLISCGHLVTSAYGRRKMIDPESVRIVAEKIRAGAFVKGAKKALAA